ncbi:bacterial transferase hexapeptide domain containing protein, partial [Musa troglodytarum]
TDERASPTLYPKRSLGFGLVLRGTNVIKRHRRCRPRPSRRRCSPSPGAQGGTPQRTDRAAVRRWGLWGWRSTPSGTGSGQAIDRLGCRLQGDYLFQEERDANSIRVGTGTNIRDDSLVHVAKSNPSGKVCQCVILISVCPGSINVYFDSGYEEDIPGSSQKKRAFISQSATDYCNLAQAHAVENAKPFDEVEFEKVLRKKFARRDEENDSMLGVVREVPPELILPDNIPLTNLPSLLNRFRSGGMVNLLRWTGVERNV